jgi:hypothetical protein
MSERKAKMPELDPVEVENSNVLHHKIITELRHMKIRGPIALEIARKMWSVIGRIERRDREFAIDAFSIRLISGVTHRIFLRLCSGAEYNIDFDGSKPPLVRRTMTLEKKKA